MKSRCPLLLLLVLTALVLCFCACDSTPAEAETTDHGTADGTTAAPTETPTEESTEAITPEATEAHTEAETDPPAAEKPYTLTATEGENGLDFIIDFPAGKDLVILQLADIQLQTLKGARTPERRSQLSGAYFTGFPSGKRNDHDFRAWRYVEEAIEKVKPDLILLTGDLVYGRYDATGEILTAYIEFMESFGIPWAPVFGNHDNESEMGVAWQCAQLEAAEHCLFKRGSVTGNGNYTVGIAQGDKLLRVFYMMDSNGCGAPSAASAADVKTGVGFEKDQIDWYTADIAALRELAPDVKISFAFHVQLRVFGEVLDKYDEYAKTWTDDIYKTYEKVWIDKLENADEGDFGIIGAELKNDWGTSAQVFEGLVALGVDSIFVGHEHCNSFSIVYEGVRLQYGQKSSAYDRYNWITPDGAMGSGWDNGTQSWNGPVGSTPLVGGTVIPLSQSGDLLMGYIYLCGEIPPYQNK